MEAKLIRGIHHIALHTRNFEAMVEFYKSAFRFVPVIEEFAWENNDVVDKTLGLNGSAARMLMLAAENCYIELFQFSAPPARSGGPAAPKDHGYTHFAIDVQDLDLEYERLVSIGMIFNTSPPPKAETPRCVYGADPDGNLIELLEVPAGGSYAMECLKARANSIRHN